MPAAAAAAAQRAPQRVTHAMLSGPDLFLIQNTPFLQRPNIHPAACRLQSRSPGTMPRRVGGHLPIGVGYGGRVAPLRARHDAPPLARGSSTLCGSMVVMVSPLSTSERF
eukprot:COSAG01_NODE_1962_length_8790_cov_10.999540_8_plen_110_part_00